LATLTTLSNAGWDGGRNLSLYNSICWNMTNHNEEQNKDTIYKMCEFRLITRPIMAFIVS
jgi:hypothetical protein